jgi:alcohol dehydrogenase class IV
MKSFTYFQPTEVRFGCGRIDEVGEVVARLGQRCLVVSTPAVDLTFGMFERIKSRLSFAGIEYAHFDNVVPNPTTECIAQGAGLAKEFKANVVLGVGGGSSIDAAKAIAVEAAHPGSCWDYLYFKQQPTERTLPIVAVSTTSGTGSQVTQVAVITETATKTKSAIYHPNIYPKVAFVDPMLMVSVPPRITASTGFDVFCHAFESLLHPATSPYTEMMAWNALHLVARHLPTVVEDGTNITSREAMAWADTLAGLCISNAGVTLPHGIGMTIGGQCPHIMHGEALAITYPEFTRFTYPWAIEQFAKMGRIYDPALSSSTDDEAAFQSCEALDRFMKQIGMWLDLNSFGASLEDVGAIADHSQVLSDYKNNPRIATRDEIYEILMRSFMRV